MVALASQTTVPKSLPIPAVIASANAPQNVTRTVARRMFAPPARAPMAPSRARKPSDAPATIGSSAFVGDTTTMSNGMAAPIENIAAEVSAACTGRAAVTSDIPSSSRAWAVRASFAMSCWATCRASGLIDASFDVDVGKLIEFKGRIVAQFFAFAREIGSFRIGLRTDRHVFAGRHRHGAGDQTRNPRDHDFMLRRGSRRHTHNQACGGDNAVVGPEHRRSHPADTADEMALSVKAAHRIFCRAVISVRAMPE